MRKAVMTRGRTPLFALLIALLVAVLVGCGKGGGAGSETGGGTNTDDTNVEASSLGTVWVLSKQTITMGDTGNQTHIVVTHELDEHGNTLLTTQQPDEGGAYVVEYTYDDDGFVTSRTEKNGDVATTVQYTLEKDANGRVIKSMGDDGSVVTRTYNDAGYVVRQVQTSTMEVGGEEGSQTAHLLSDVSYDDEGFMTAHNSETVGHQTQSTRSYERNEAGQVTSATTVSTNAGDENQLTLVSTVECDEHGNVVRVVDQTNATGYTYMREFEYTEVANPSLGAWINAHIKLV